MTEWKIFQYKMTYLPSLAIETPTKHLIFSLQVQHYKM